MSRRSRRPRLPLRIKLLAAAAGGLLAWPVISTSLALSHGTDRSDFAAADFAGTSQMAATTAAIQRLDDGDPAGAEVFAKQALKVSPISAPSLRTLGLAKEAEGDWRQAGAILSQASALGWRDVPSQLWLAQASLQTRDYMAVANHLDAALRTVNDQALYPIVDQAILTPGVGDALITRFALAPGWRPTYLQTTAGASPEAIQARARLIAGLSGTAAPASPAELNAILNAQIKFGHFRDARRLWSITRHINAGPIYDPRFEHIETSSTIAFQWSLPHVLGTTTSTGNRPGGSEPGLTISTDGSAAGVIARQITVLKPGRHALGYAASVPDGAGSTFSWTIRCIGSEQPLLDAPLDARSPHMFDVPEGTCEGQRIELHVRGNPLPKPITAWFSDITLD